MPKDHSIRCHGCNQQLINFNDFSRPQICPACFEQLSIAERIQIKTLAQIQEHLRHEAIMSEHRDSHESIVARLAKAIERMTVESRTGATSVVGAIESLLQRIEQINGIEPTKPTTNPTTQPPKFKPGYGPAQN